MTRALAALLVTYSEETLLDLCGHEENREKEKAEVKNRVRVGVRVTESKTEERMEEKREQTLLQVAMSERKQKDEHNANNNSPRQAAAPGGEYPYFFTLRNPSFSIACANLGFPPFSIS